MTEIGKRLEENIAYIKEMIKTQNVVTNDKLESIKETLNAVKEQTIRTNGRVSKLEWWRTTVVSLIAFLYGFLILITPTLIKIINQSIDTKIVEAVKEALKEYEIYNTTPRK